MQKFIIIPIPVPPANVQEKPQVHDIAVRTVLLLLKLLSNTHDTRRKVQDIITKLVKIKYMYKLKGIILAIKII